MIKIHIPCTWKRRVEPCSFFPCGQMVQLEEEAGAGGAAAGLGTSCFCFPAGPLRTGRHGEGSARTPAQAKAWQTWHRRPSLTFRAPLMALTIVPQGWHSSLIKEMHENPEENNCPNWFFSSLASCWTWMPGVESRGTVKPWRKQTVKETEFPEAKNKGSPAREAPEEWVLSDLKMWW